MSIPVRSEGIDHRAHQEDLLINDHVPGYCVADIDRDQPTWTRIVATFHLCQIETERIAESFVPKRG
jgi:hypothetical protein